MGCAQGKQSREDTGGGVEEKGRRGRPRRPVITLKEKKLQKHLFKKNFYLCKMQGEARTSGGREIYVFV